MNIVKKISYMLVFMLVTSLNAQDYSTSIGRSMLLGGGARAGGLAGTYSAVGEDATTIYWNPGGLGGIKAIESKGLVIGKDKAVIGFDNIEENINYSTNEPIITTIAPGSA